MKIWRFRIDRKYRAIFIFRERDVIEILDINNHYQWTRLAKNKKSTGRLLCLCSYLSTRVHLMTPWGRCMPDFPHRRQCILSPFLRMVGMTNFRGCLQIVFSCLWSFSIWFWHTKIFAMIRSTVVAALFIYCPYILYTFLTKCTLCVKHWRGAVCMIIFFL